jgi:hypothetical protein
MMPNEISNLNYMLKQNVAKIPSEIQMMDETQSNRSSDEDNNEIRVNAEVSRERKGKNRNKYFFHGIPDEIRPKNCNYTLEVWRHKDFK